jgi:hypothetical protein
MQNERKTKDKENNEVWQSFKEHAQKVLKEDDITILDRIAIYPTLDAVSKGLCNSEVAKYLELDVEDVEEDLKDFSDFEGFDTNVSLSPIKVFTNNHGNFVKIFQYHKDLEFALRLEFFLGKFAELKKELDDYYNKET